MATISVQFRHLTGLKRQISRNVRLKGSWDSLGKFSDDWSETPMTERLAEDGCPSFTATVQFDLGEVGKQFRWGVVLDACIGPTRRRSTRRRNGASHRSPTLSLRETPRSASTRQRRPPVARDAHRVAAWRRRDFLPHCGQNQAHRCATRKSRDPARCSALSARA
jgi:hypothetical protein